MSHLLSYKNKNGQVSESELSNYPYLIYGHGLYSFLKLNNWLVRIFFLLSFLAVIQMLVFRSFGGVVDFKGYSIITNWSFGSFGYPKALCSKNLINWSDSSQDSIELNFKCQANTQITEVLSTGIVSYSSSDDYAGLVDVFSSCYYSNKISKNTDGF